jgi:hypothetical protein
MNSGRYTLDGDCKLEAQIAMICDKTRDAILEIVPRNRIDGMLLGGGYGRGEGGVLETDEGQKPYNDLEFYLLLRGNRLLNQASYGKRIHEAAHRLSEQVGIEVEVKLLTLRELEQGPLSMFYHDLFMGHRWVLGTEDLLAGCERLGRAEDIPNFEAARLLMNRVSGLLFSRERLQRTDFTLSDADFVGRNLAKAKLGLGDAILALDRKYHWSCMERHRRLDKSTLLQAMPWYRELLALHEEGVRFKLHPHQSTETREALQHEHESITELAWNVWSYIEQRRLDRFTSPLEYALSVGNKCPETGPGKNLLVNGKLFLSTKRFPPRLSRYPRERLLNALPLLLWEQDSVRNGIARDFLRRELQTTANDFGGFVQAYEKLWQKFN